MKGFQKPHVVAVPFPALGHSIPFLDLSRLLASHGLTATYVTTPANVSRLQQPILEALDIRVVVLHAPAVEGLAEGRESTDLLPSESSGLIFELAEKLQGQFNRWIERQLEGECQEQGTGPPVCVIHDLFVRWAPETAHKHNIASFLFNPSGAFAMSLLHSVSGTMLQGPLEKEGDSVVVSSNLPRPLRLHTHEIDVEIMNPDLSDSMVQFFIGRYQSIGKGCGILINSFHELEPAYLQHLKNVTGKPVWGICPLLPPNYFVGAAAKLVGARGKMADISEEELVGWLDSQNPCSVVYVSFGSQTFLSEQQTNALAKCLEATEKPFVWAIKVAPKIDTATLDSTYLAIRHLPEGFQERTKNRGVVICGWAPQLVILSHPSVGAFMSHCGWNSALESITHGVPIIAWPMFGDQHFNAKLVRDLGVGIQFCQHRDGLPEQERVKEVVRLVFNGEEGEEMKKRVEKLKRVARKAVEDGGSSKAGLQTYINEVNKLNLRSESGNLKQDY